MGLLAGAGGLLSGCALVANRVAKLEEKHYPPTVAATNEERVLNRVGFGPNAASLEEYREMGHAAFVERELKAGQPEDLGLLLQLQRLDVLQLAPSDLWDLPFEVVLAQLQQAAILRATHGKNQLQERMVDFWSNHFNIYARKGNTGYSKGTEESQIVRKNALASFPDMLKEMAHSPCMLEFLDNEYNRKGVANENYARELMELHTLGLHGGYTQKDVEEVARCFTGWTVETRFLHPKGQFRFDPDTHDDREKTVLGHRIPAGGGVSDGETVLDILSTHPSTAKFLAIKLSLYFLGSEDAGAIASMSQAYMKTAGNIPSVLRPILEAKTLTASDPVLKRPFDLMVSALRITEAESDGGVGLQSHLDKMGEPLYQWPMPDGYPVKTASWTSSLLPRWNFAIALTHGQIAGASCDDKAVSMLAGKIGRHANGDSYAAALCLASPEFQWR